MVIRDQCAIFKPLFKGREDIYAIRWEKNGKSGYSPAYDMNWQEYSLHKAKGGSLDDFPHKKYALLTEEKLLRHLSGKEVIGIYPLLQDNTSWFIVADFDQPGSRKKIWTEACQTFIAQCEKYQLPVYLERSRSGLGGHVWMFFDAPYPASKSRQLFLALLTDSGILSSFDKNSNFDRLFPNQDSHSGKGFGNLIALPMQKKLSKKKIPVLLILQHLSLSKTNGHSYKQFKRYLLKSSMKCLTIFPRPIIRLRRLQPTRFPSQTEKFILFFRIR